MEAVSWTNGTWGMSHHGIGHGPWIMADLENGLFSNNPLHGPSKEEPIVGARYVTAMIKGDSGNHWAIKGGDATVANGLKTLYDGDRPCTMRHEIDCENHEPNYNPMRKQVLCDILINLYILVHIYLFIYMVMHMHTVGSL